MTSSASFIVFGETQRSMSMPRRFISPMTILPNGVSRCNGLSVAESAQSLLSKCVIVVARPARKAGEEPPASCRSRPAFHSNQRRDLAAVMMRTTSSAVRASSNVSIHFVEPVHDVDLLQHGADGIPTFERRRNVDGPELPADPPLPQPRDVSVQRRCELALILTDVDLREMVLHAVRVLLRKIVVSVDERHVAQDAIDARGDRVGLRVRRCGDEDEGKSERLQTIHGAHDSRSITSQVMAEGKCQV